MKNLLLFYFSGTGNTKLVANHIQNEFQEMGWQVTIVNIEDIAQEADIPDTDQFDLIGIGSQVIGYTIPRKVSQFIKMLPDSLKRTRVFIFRTCGGVAETNYTASHRLIHMLRKKNYDVFHERLFSIGSNWIMKFDDDIMRQLYEATKRKIKIMCHEVVEGKERFYQTRMGFRLKKKMVSGLANFIFPYLGKNMKIERSCTKCGICIKNCPAKNIYLADGQIKFKSDCSACMRCIYGCPKKAIKFRFLSFIPLKNGYNVNQSLFHPEDEEEVKNGKIPPFCEKYLLDDEM